MRLLPGGGAPRVHRARSPVPPRLPQFATPRSVHQRAAVAAGAYPPRRPPDAWSPGMPALSGRCYWLVASGTPVGWRRGCLAFGLVRGAVRNYCLGGCSDVVVCARCSRMVRGGWGQCRVLYLPRFPLPAPCFPRCVWRAVPSGCPLSSLAGTPFHAVCALRGLGPFALLVFPACPLRVCALALSRRLRPPLSLGWCGARTSRGPGAPLVLPRSRATFGSLGGGARSCFPLPGLGLRAPRGVGAGVGVGTRHQPHRVRSCELALRAGLARCRGGTRASGGGRLLPWWRRPGSGALPTPTTRPFGRAAGAHYLLAVCAGGAGVGSRHQPHSARSCELAFRAVGAA